MHPGAKQPTCVIGGVGFPTGCLAREKDRAINNPLSAAATFTHLHGGVFSEAVGVSVDRLPGLCLVQISATGERGGREA